MKRLRDPNPDSRYQEEAGLEEGGERCANLNTTQTVGRLGQVEGDGGGGKESGYPFGCWEESSDDDRLTSGPGPEGEQGRRENKKGRSFEKEDGKLVI